MRVFAIVLMLAGCGGSSQSGSDLGSGGSSGDGGGGIGGDAGGTVHGGIGFVSAGITQATTTVTASFETFASAVSLPTDLMTIGACILQSVPPTTNAAVTQRSAGTLTLSGGTQTVTLTPTMPAMYSLYTVYSSMTSLWSGGETLTVSVPGDEAPAFTISTTAPSVVQFTQPAPVAIGTTVTFDRSTDFRLTWSGGSAGDVQFVVAANTTSMPGVYRLQLYCRFPASAGSATIPAATLQLLPSNATGYYAMQGSGRKIVTVADWQIVVDVYSRYDVPNQSDQTNGAEIQTN